MRAIHKKETVVLELAAALIGLLNTLTDIDPGVLYPSWKLGPDTIKKIACGSITWLYAVMSWTCTGAALTYLMVPIEQFRRSRTIRSKID